MKLKWRVQPEPTGPYSSFFVRGWPSAKFEDGRTAAVIHCDDDYVPRNARTGNHGELTVRIAWWTAKLDGRFTFEWRTLKKRVKTLPEAKELALAFFRKYPNMEIEKLKGETS